MDKRALRARGQKIFTRVKKQGYAFVALSLCGLALVSACADAGYRYFSTNDDFQDKVKTSSFGYYHLYRDLLSYPKYPVEPTLLEESIQDDGRSGGQDKWLDERNKYMSQKYFPTWVYSQGECTRPSYESALVALRVREGVYTASELQSWITDREDSWGGCAAISAKDGGNYDEGVTPAVKQSLLAKEKALKQTAGVSFDSKSPQKLSWFSRFFSAAYHKTLSFFGFKKSGRSELPAQSVATSGDDTTSIVVSGITLTKRDLKIQDLEYHLAAAAFYANNFDDAELRVKRIAEDSNSVWQREAKLTLGRIYIKRAQAVGPRNQSPLLTLYASQDIDATSEKDSLKSYQEHMKRAYDYFVLLRKDPTMVKYADDVSDFADYTFARANPFGRLKQVSEVLSKKEVSEEVVTKLLPDLHQVQNVTQMKETGDDLLDWLLVVGNYGAEQPLYDVVHSLSYDHSARDKQTELEVSKRLYSIARKNFLSLHNSEWAYAVAALASQDSNFKDKELARNAAQVLDKKLYRDTASTAVLEKVGLLVIKHPDFFTSDEIRRYYKLISTKGDELQSLAFMLAQTNEEAGPYLDLRDFSSLSQETLKKLFPFAKDVKNYLALEIFRRAGLFEDWQTASEYARSLTWPPTMGAYSSDDDKGESHQYLVDKFVKAPDDATRKLLYVALASTKSEMWACGYKKDTESGKSPLPQFMTVVDTQKRENEKKVTEKNTTVWIGKYLATLSYQTIDKNFQDVIPSAMGDYVSLVTRYNHCYDDEKTGYSKKVFNSLKKDFPDSKASKVTDYYY